MAKTATGKTSQRAGRVVRKVSAARSVTTRRLAGKTPQRAVRVPDQLWHQAKEAAEQRGENVTQVIKRALVRYIRETARRQAASERFDSIRAKIPPEQRLSEEEALRLAGEEKAAMRAERDRAEAD
jgi:hypothetical protein